MLRTYMYRSVRTASCTPSCYNKRIKGPKQVGASHIFTWSVYWQHNIATVTLNTAHIYTSPRFFFDRQTAIGPCRRRNTFGLKFGILYEVIINWLHILRCGASAVTVVIDEGKVPNFIFYRSYPCAERTRVNDLKAVWQLHVLCSIQLVTLDKLVKLPTPSKSWWWYCLISLS